MFRARLINSFEGGRWWLRRMRADGRPPSNGYGNWVFSSPACLSAVVPLRLRTRHPFAEGPAQKIEFVSSCQSRNNSMGASGAYAPSPSRQLTRPGRLRAEEILLCFAPATQRCGFCVLLPEILLAGDQPRPGTPPSSGPRPVLRGWHCLFVSPVRIPSPVRGCFAAPFLPLQSEPSADVCCVASRVACA
jgi:hypothetical protein